MEIWDRKVYSIFCKAILEQIYFLSLISVSQIFGRAVSSTTLDFGNIFPIWRDTSDLPIGIPTEFFTCNSFLTQK
jgi:hypothetical protein